MSIEKSMRYLEGKLLHQDYVKQIACCECGFHRNGKHHPKVKCPQSGRCGSCGNDWPCSRHNPKKISPRAGA